jgi:hypothetical protein
MSPGTSAEIFASDDPSSPIASLSGMSQRGMLHPLDSLISDLLPTSTGTVGATATAVTTGYVSSPFAEVMGVPLAEGSVLSVLTEADYRAAVMHAATSST